MPSQYWISKDSYLCCTDGKIVFWNSREGTYGILDACQTGSIHQHVTGWPIFDNNENASPKGLASVNELLNELVANGVLVKEAWAGRDATPASVETATQPLLDEYSPTDIKVSVSEFANFLRASAFATLVWGLRGASSGRYRYKLPARIRRWKRRPGRGQATENDIYAMKRTLISFTKLRPLLPNRRDMEKFERVMLLKLFEYRGFRADWVFGVTGTPFTSYSWLQCNGFLIDEAPSFLSAFTAIHVI